MLLENPIESIYWTCDRCGDNQKLDYGWDWLPVRPKDAPDRDLQRTICNSCADSLLESDDYFEVGFKVRME